MLTFFIIIYAVTFFILTFFFRDATGFSWPKSVLLGFTCTIPIFIEIIYFVLNFFLSKLCHYSLQVGFILGGEDNASIQEALIVNAVTKELNKNMGDKYKLDSKDEDNLQ